MSKNVSKKPVAVRRNSRKNAGSNETIQEKVRHVKAATQTREHHCHWPGCTQQVAPALWGCPYHWYRLPERLRSRIWATYRVGQERTKTPSKAYLIVALEVQAWIAENFPQDVAKKR